MIKHIRILLATLLILAISGVVWAAKRQKSAAPVTKTEVSGKQEPTQQRQTATRIARESRETGRPDAPVPQRIIEGEMDQKQPHSATAAAAYDIPWHSINGGGGASSSTNFSVNGSAGQSTTGFATSTNYQAGIGYWYGAEAIAGGCSCPFQSDFDEDGFLTALDLGGMIDVLFAGDPDVSDPDCPNPRADFDCDGFSTALDLGNLIDHLFAGGAGPIDPCGS